MKHYMIISSFAAKLFEKVAYTIFLDSFEHRRAPSHILLSVKCLVDVSAKQPSRLAPCRIVVNIKGRSSSQLCRALNEMVYHMKRSH